MSQKMFSRLEADPLCFGGFARRAAWSEGLTPLSCSRGHRRTEAGVHEVVAIAAARSSAQYIASSSEEQRLALSSGMSEIGRAHV